MKPSHRWLVDLTHLPTTSGHEDRVARWVARWAARRDEIKLKTDRAGNILLTLKGRKRHRPVIATAHMDHPGWVIEGFDGARVRARFMGGVMEQYFEGAPVVFFGSDDGEHPGKVEDYTDGIGTIRLARRSDSLAIGDIGRWRFDKRTLGIKADLLRAPGCDDLAGVAAALTALDRARKKPELNHYGVLLTRAEEVGLVGAIAAGELGTIPDSARLLSIETSRSFADSPIGDGPIIRVGDRSSVFDAPLTNAVTNAVRAAGITHQRKLMAGGSCEGTAFGAYGYTATGLCLALGNYHNMFDIDGVQSDEVAAVVAPEEIALADYDGLVDLILCAARDIDASTDTIRDRLSQNYETHKALLGL